MDKVKRFFELKELWKKSSEVERAKIDQELSVLMDSMDATEEEALVTGVHNDFQRMGEEAKEIKRTLTIRQQLDSILPYISVASLAKDYFGKSSSWFYQRLNGNLVHGKTVSFTENEIRTLNTALKEIGSKLMKMSIMV